MLTQDRLDRLQLWCDEVRQTTHRGSLWPVIQDLEETLAEVRKLRQAARTTYNDLIAEHGSRVAHVNFMVLHEAIKEFDNDPPV